MDSISFVCEPIRNKDNDGELVSAGVRWREGVELRRERMIWAGVLFAVACVIFVLGVSIGGGAISPFSFVALCFLGGGFAAAAKSAPDRILLFSVDDAIDTPLGLHRYPDVTRFNTVASDIVSVEVVRSDWANKDGFKHEVRFLSDEGKTLHIAIELREEDAVQLARQLTKALSEIRGQQRPRTYALAS